MFILFLLMLLAASIVGVDICPTKSMKVESNGEIVGPNLVRLYQPLNCMLTLTDISPGSWIGVFKDTLNLRRVDYLPCETQPVKLAISHSAQGTECFCDADLPEVVYTGYSPNSASLTFQLLAEASYYNPAAVELHLSYKVARVIYSSENVQITEGIKEQDSIVSHSSYLSSSYGSNINSSLMLNNARLGSWIRLKFYKLDLSPNCADYLRVTGIVSPRGSNSTFCSTTTSSVVEMEYFIISSVLSFNFVSTGWSREVGFHLHYKVQPESGCDQPKITESSVKVNTSDRSYKTYSVECNEGLHFSDRVKESLRVVCYEETWWILSSCTDKCGYYGDKCFKRCNVTSDVLNQLECIPRVNEPRATIAELMLGVAISLIVLAALVGFTIYNLRQRYAVKCNGEEEMLKDCSNKMDGPPKPAPGSTGMNVSIQNDHLCTPDPPVRKETGVLVSTTVNVHQL